MKMTTTKLKSQNSFVWAYVWNVIPSYSGVSNKQACFLTKFLVYFQPACHFLLHKNKQLGPCQENYLFQGRR